MREVDCLTCGCRVRKCKWARHILSKKHLMSAGDKGSEDGAGGVASQAGCNRPSNYIIHFNI